MRIYIFILLFLPFLSFSQTQECATSPTQAQIDYLSQTRSSRSNWNGPEMITNLPVQHHVVRETNGTGGLTLSNISFVMNALNTYYANSNLSFFDCGTINYIDNSSYYNFNQSQESSVCGANDVTNVINIYYFNSVSSSSGGSLCGYTRFPPSVDRIIMKNSCAINGSTIVHELGHYFSLYHTHGKTNSGTTTELVNGSNCSTAGDDICDTPADPNLSGLVTSSCQYTGTAVDVNGQAYVPDPTNIMSYSQKVCRTFLSSDQYNRVNYSAINDRGYLNCNTVVYGCTDPNSFNYDPNATIDDGSCTYCTTTLPYSEDFNNGIGNWTNTGSAGNWSLNSGGTPSNSTGPTSDFSGSGNYMYIESSSPNYPSVGPFTLSSECFDLSNSTNPSLSFYYNMYGSGMGTLDVYANSSLIWSLNGNQGQGWNLVQIPLTSVGNTLIIEFKATTGSSYTSDIAIDDINIISIQPVSGCTDPVAINYNANATVDDGSCIYPILVSLGGVNVSCNGGTDGSCSSTTSGGQPPYTYLWNTGETTSYINNLSAGIYTITVTDNSGQTQANSFTVLEPLPLLLSFIITNESAAGSNDGAIDMTVTGGTTPYLYYWNTNPTQTTEDISNLSAGDYIVYVGFNNWTCLIGDTVTVNSSTIYGCTNPIACNYDPSAITDDGSCIFQQNPIDNMSAYNYTLSFHWGCSGIIYNSEMEFDSSGSAVVNPGTVGATNVTWSLCDSVLTWVYTDGTQYTSNLYDNGTFTGTMISGSGSSTGCFTLTPIIAGCLDSTSLLYNPQANVDDGSCCAHYLRLNMYSSWPGGWSGGIYWTMMDDNGDTVISTALTYNSSTDTYHNVDYICVPDGCYTIVCSNGGGSGGISWTLKDDSTNSTIVSGGCPFGPYITAIGTSCVIMGCTDPNANNYYPHANLDDGSCTYSCGQITGVYMSDVIHDRAIFNWDNMNSPYCQVDQIRIRYREVGTSSWSTKTMGVPVGSGCNTSNTSKRILSLLANTTYEYKFKIWYCNASTVIWHADGTFTTLPVCDNVTNVTATPITTNKTQFCWDSVSAYAFVRLQYREDVPGSSFSNIGGMGVLSPTLCKDKNGITPGLQYRVMWRTWCSPNGGPYRSPQWDGPVTWTQPTSIRVDQLSSISSLEVYPNPSGDVFNVSFNSDSKQYIEIRVVNLIGEIIYVENLENFEGEYIHSFNLSEYSKGIYLLELDTDNGMVNKKLILQ